MGKGYGMSFRIYKIQRHAVRKKGSQINPRLIGKKTVHIRVIPSADNALSSIRPAHYPQIGRMSLVGADNILHTAMKRVCNAPVVFVHRFLSVTSGVA